jgi:cobalt/nickel transport system permease protein
MKMHIPENYLSPVSCAVMTAAMIPIWYHAAQKTGSTFPKEKIPFLGIGASFSFLGMMFNIPLVGGTTGHAVGGTLLAIMLGPNAACIAISIALLLQAVLFGDGGILSWGANCFNMAFILPFSGYAIYKLITRLYHNLTKKEEGTAIRCVASAIGSYIGINLAALCTAIEFGIQPILFSDAAGNALYCPYGLSVAIPAMMIPHLAVAGFVEAIFTVAILAFILKISPDLIFDNNAFRNNSEKKRRFPIFALLAILIAATPLGLIASGTAWGEWGADEISNISENGTPLGYTPRGMIEGLKINTLFPDYSIDGTNSVIAYILSAIIGVALLIIIFKILSQFLNRKTKRS